MNKNKKTNITVVILSLMLVLFIDGMGQGIIFPILVKAFLDSKNYHFLTSVNQSYNTLIYSIILASFFIAWFVGSAILGDFSDAIGRKKALIICLFGSLLGFLLSAFAFYYHSLSMLIIGRLIDGFTAGSQPIAQAAIIDIGSEKNKARNIGFILIAVTIGLVLGPIIGGFLSDPNLISWFNLSTPFLFGALLSFANIIFLYILFDETRKSSGKFKFYWSNIIDTFSSVIKDKQLFYLICAFFFMTIGWAIYFVYIPAYLANQFHQSGNMVALFNALVGLGLSFGLSILTQKFSKLYPSKFLVAIGYGILPIGYILFFMFSSLATLWITVLVISAGMGLGYTVVISMFSELVNEDRQGWIMGIAGSFSILAFSLSSLFSGILAEISFTLPLFVSFFASIIGCVLIALFKRPNTN